MSYFPVHQYSKVQREDENEDLDPRPWVSRRWMRLVVLAMFCFTAGAIFAEGFGVLRSYLRQPPPTLECKLTRKNKHSSRHVPDYSTQYEISSMASITTEASPKPLPLIPIVRGARFFLCKGASS